MRRLLYIWTSACLILVLLSDSVAANALATSCSSPFITGAIGASLDAIALTWLDPFSMPGKTYDLEIVPASMTPTGEPTHEGIEEFSITATGLESGTLYQIFIRSDCETEWSTWNGPVLIATQIDNEQACGLQLPIFDNNCPMMQEYIIAVQMTNVQALGESISLQKVELIIEHPWLADLSISLINPAGTEVSLTSNNGVGAQNFGIPSDTTCSTPFEFSSFACINVTEIDLDFTGSAQPEEPLSALNDGSSQNGEWLLRLCDKAADDIGVLKYVRLVFSENTCDFPPELSVLFEGDTTAFLFIASDSLCDELQIVYDTNLTTHPDSIVGTVSKPCNSDTVEVNGLQPGTDYVLYARRLCGSDTSQWTCPISITTTCNLITIGSDFDGSVLCDPLCTEKCPLADDIWINLDGDDTDWIAFEGPTPTDFTGPAAARHGSGRYLYTESSGSSCGDSARAVLQSRCLQIATQENGCDLSFWFHLFGSHAGSLLVEISTDAGNNWMPLWLAIGDHGNQWVQASINLSMFHGEFASFRITGTRGNGFLSDIGLDEILFYGSTPVDSLSMRYFPDVDMDTFGANDSAQCFCQSAPPAGYVDNNLDCNDQEPDINPASDEIPCNLTDDNCNGEIDEGINPDPILYEVLSIADAACTGIDDGSIHIEATQGAAPFQYLWNTQQDTNSISDLTPGVYRCTITDASGCVAVTEFFVIDQTAVINYFVVGVEDPSCPGAGDGSIDGALVGGQEPYSFIWSNGATTLDIEGLDNDTYQLTITDANGCWLTSDSIALDADPSFDLALIQKQDVPCFGGSNGVLQIIAPGAVAPVDYQWSNDDTTALVENLAAGLYSCTVTDATGCLSVLEDILIGSPDPLIIAIDVSEPPLCFGSADGTIQLSVNGGSPPYFYQWSSSAITDDLFNIGPGLYSVTVSDIHGCQSVMDSIVLDAPVQITPQVNMLQHVPCPGDTTGLIAVDVSGGTAPYQYGWSNGFTDSATISQLGIGSYAVTISDVFGCKGILRDIDLIALNEPLIVTILQTFEIACHGDSTAAIFIEVNDGNAPFWFNWSAGQEHFGASAIDSLSNLAAGTYDVTITDSRGCVGTSDAIELQQPEALLFQLDFIESVTCYGGSDGLIGLSVWGGTSPYTYQWTSGDSTKDISGLMNGKYQLSITDSNGCFMETPAFSVPQPDTVALLFEVGAVSIKGNDGWAEVEILGTSGPFQYHWDEQTGFQQGHRAEQLVPGIYSVSVTDVLKCMYEDSVIVPIFTSVSNPLALALTVYPNPANQVIYLRGDDLPFIIAVWNPLGHRFELSTEKADHNVMKCAVDILPEGVYFLEVNGLITAIRVIIVRS